jgi:4-aminobutyrate aminotransferase
MAEAVLYRALDEGLSFKTTMGNVLTLTPPLTTSVAEMDAALDILERCILSEAARRT